MGWDAANPANLRGASPSDGTVAARRPPSPRRQLPVLHPVLFSLYPILALFAVSLQELTPDQPRRALVVVPLAVVLLLVFLRLLFGDWHRAGLAATAIVLIAFSYGHIYLLLERVQIAGNILGRHRYLIPLGLLALLGLFLWLWMARPDLRSATRTLNLIAAAAVLIALLSIGITLLRIRSDSTSESLSALALQTHLDPPKDAPLPDVYYIILDGYARSDYMLSVFGYDNSEFIAFLESRGFYVARDSHTNHNWTSLSLASSLNMTHAQNLGLHLVRGNYPGVFVGRIRNSLTRRNFESMGYEIVALRSGYTATEWIDADRYLGPGVIELEDLEEPMSLNAFEGMLLQSSAGLILLDLGDQEVRTWTRMRTSQPYDLLREIILHQFDSLPEVAASPGPKFVFTHIVAPHSPYLFGAKGERQEISEPFTLVEPGQEDQASSSAQRYTNQAMYITSRIETAIDGILANSAVPPIIILQADHGSGAAPGYRSGHGQGLRQRTAILNAYRLPEACRSKLYASITPVNSFRVVFNCVYGAEYSYLPDDVYFSPWPYESDYSFTLVNDRLD